MQGHENDPDRDDSHEVASPPEAEAGAVSGPEVENETGTQAERVAETAGADPDAVTDAVADSATDSAAEADAPEDDTLDVVRQMIAEAETLPEPAPEPKAQAPVALEPVVVAAAKPAWSLDDDEDWGDDGAAGDADEDWDADGADWDEDAADESWDGEAAEAAPRRPGLVARAMAALGRGLLALLRIVLRWLGRMIAKGWRRLLVFLRRPDAPRRLSVVVIVAAAVTWPWFVLKIAFLVPLGLVTLWAATGNRGFAELVVNWYEWLKERDPVKAERLRKAAAWTSRTIMKGVDRLPSHWTTGFSLPDFEGDIILPEKMQVDPFEDLAERVRREKHQDARS